MNGHRLLAAVDLGSNSFRLLIGRVESTPVGDQILPLDGLKESVRLAAGLDQRGMLDAASQARALSALSRFAERLRSFSPETVRTVGTNTLRVARNARRFLPTAEAALGFPIEVIGGREEARLIYLGAAHALPADRQDRLVVDIGGGSTECIIGADYDAALLESAGVGCVSISQQFFPGGEVDRNSFEQAYYAARDVLAPTARAYRSRGWSYAVGTSGTAKALAQLAQLNFASDQLTREALLNIEWLLIKAGHADRLRLEGLRPERRPVLAGGLAVMSAVFDELGIGEMRYCPAALRQGVLYDLLGRRAGADMREITVEQMMQRYAVDAAHARRVARTAVALFEQGARGAAELLAQRRELLRWAVQLAEIGLSIAHDSFHKHSAYILSNADMPGFTRSEQATMAHLALGQVGGLRKLRELVADDLEWLMVLSMRVASILHRRRDVEETPLPALFLKRRGIRLELPKAWAKAHPLSDQTLRTEMATWAELRVFDEIVYERI
jgi:exopolyphosphatase/guanosine-5'-triphosphate,3'-diphosphate pyrophosphatase